MKESNLSNVVIKKSDFNLIKIIILLIILFMYVLNPLCSGKLAKA
tara:strand:+ start:88 stop:222 length:135 start_codon:yes stop_codon:yes gene_type:complete